MITALVLVVSLLTMQGKTTDVTVVTLSRGALSVPLQPTGKADLKRDPTMTRISIEVDRVAPPSSLGPVFNSFVVWAVSPEGYYQNVGELAFDKDRGRLETTTPFDQIGILITAEPHHLVDRPSAAVAFRSLAPKNDIRRQTVSVEVGAYDYSNIAPANSSGGPSIVAEARAAVRIAEAAKAERFAESDYRRARAALDTTEQLLSRASPADIIAESANETIRRSQRAVTLARAKSNSQ